EAFNKRILNIADGIRNFSQELYTNFFFVTQTLESFKARLKDSSLKSLAMQITLEGEESIFSVIALMRNLDRIRDKLAEPLDPFKSIVTSIRSIQLPPALKAF